MDHTPRLQLPYLLPNQAQKHVTLNDSLKALDQLTGMVIKSRQVGAEPSSPSEGDAYLLPNGASGASWTALDAGALVYYADDSWHTQQVPHGLRAWIEDESALLVRALSGWEPATPQSLERLGIGTLADASNRFAVKSDAVLFGHDDVTPGNGDMRVSVNRFSSTNVASVLFQTDHSTGGEIGLTGTDDLELRASHDGTSFNTGVTLRAADGKVGFPAGFSDPNGMLAALQFRIPVGTIADDTVSIVDFNEAVFGASILALPNALSSAPIVLFFARMASSPSLTDIFSAGHSFTTTTGTLVGTSGDDGKINFSVTSDGRFMIENRRGYPVTYTLFVFR